MDLDYDKAASTTAKILSSVTTNATIKKFAEPSLGNNNITIKDLYEWQTMHSPIIIDNIICLAFQNSTDGYSRTLEGTMLAKLYEISSIDIKSRDEWKNLRKYGHPNTDGKSKAELNELQRKHELKFTIPRNKDDFDINTIVLHTSNGKTDFMYSVILKGLVELMLPNYIREALIWLQK